MAERVAQELRHQPLGRHPRRRPGQRAQQRAMATADEVADQREGQELRLQQRRGEQQHRRPVAAPMRVGADARRTRRTPRP